MMYANDSQLERGRLTLGPVPSILPRSQKIGGALLRRNRPEQVDVHVSIDINRYRLRKSGGGR
jgi:hypothetical protein